MAALSNAFKADNLKSLNSIKLSFTNICGLRLNFVDCESFLESNSLCYLLCVRLTWMNQLILAIFL